MLKSISSNKFQTLKIFNHNFYHNYVDHVCMTDTPMSIIILAAFFKSSKIENVVGDVMWSFGMQDLCMGWLSQPAE